MGEGAKSGGEASGSDRQRYGQAMLDLRSAFEAAPHLISAGSVAVAARASAVDALIQSLWSKAQSQSSLLQNRVSLVAVGGYGRCELFPFSDVDLMFLLDPRVSEKSLRDPIRMLNQQLWDAGLRLSPMIRTLTECERFNPENVEFTLSLLDARLLGGDPELYQRLTLASLPRTLARKGKKVVARLAEVSRHRHQRYGSTLFHLEPNIKDCPGGLRDAHLCAWLRQIKSLEENAPTSESPFSDEFSKAREFLVLVRTFLHLRHGRDDNTLDWQAQDQAAAISLGLAQASHQPLDPAYWMRLYFRHARTIERTAAQALEDAAPIKKAASSSLFKSLRVSSTVPANPPASNASSANAPASNLPLPGFEQQRDIITLNPATASTEDPAHDPEIMLQIFAAMAKTGAVLARASEQRLEDALPFLSAHLEDGPGLWRHLEKILLGPHAGLALRTMHAIGILELLLPEFHGIDALVIRDAYHRYTVDEHTFVLIDTLHGLLTGAAGQGSVLEPWAARFAPILQDLPHPGLFFLAALLHDTGKGHSSSGHALESVRLAENVVRRLDLDSYESGLVFGLIRNHLEMSAALRRDVFAAETIRAFAAYAPTPESLRMLTVFTYADIAAVHPDALTPWKAEKLHYLYIATAKYLDRNVDDERVGTSAESDVKDVIHRVSTLFPARRLELERFLAGFPQRYLLTRTRDEIAAHFEMASRIAASSGSLSAIAAGAEDHPATPPVELSFRYAPEGSELTLVSSDRPMLFANMAGALASWGMNVVTADAFSNASGTVVDTFRFVDSFRTLELNPSERERFVDSVRQTLTGTVPVERMLAARGRARRKAPMTNIATHLQFDDTASALSTLLEVVAQDTPGLLRALTLTLAVLGCNIEVALVDTEGEMAIDVFYITRAGAKLGKKFQDSLGRTLQEAIEANAR